MRVFIILCAQVLMRTCAATITLETPDTRGTLEQAKLETEDIQNAWQRRRTSIWAKKPANASLSMPSMPFNCLRGKRDGRANFTKFVRMPTNPGGKAMVRISVADLGRSCHPKYCAGVYIILPLKNTAWFPAQCKAPSIWIVSKNRLPATAVPLPTAWLKPQPRIPRPSEPHGFRDAISKTNQLQKPAFPETQYNPNPGSHRNGEFGLWCQPGSGVFCLDWFKKQTPL